MSSQQQRGASPLPCTPRPVTSSMQAASYKQQQQAHTRWQQRCSSMIAYATHNFACQLHASSTALSCRRRTVVPSHHLTELLTAPSRACPTRPRPRRLRRHAFHAQGRASTPSPATSTSLPQAAGHLTPAAAPARSPSHRCPSGLVQQHRRRVASTPRHELPQPPLTQARAPRRLRLAEPPSRSYKETPSPSTAPRTSQLAPSLSLASQRHHQSRPPPSSVLAQRKVTLVDLPLRAAPAQGEPGTSIPIHSSLSLCPWI
jgi:hypothetical protein